MTGLGQKVNSASAGKINLHFFSFDKINDQSYFLCRLILLRIFMIHSHKSHSKWCWPTNKMLVSSEIFRVPCHIGFGNNLKCRKERLLMIHYSIPSSTNCCGIFFLLPYQIKDWECVRSSNDDRTDFKHIVFNSLCEIDLRTASCSRVVDYCPVALESISFDVST